MPYIAPEDRERLVAEFNGLDVPEMLGEACETAGELNYVFTLIAQSYVKSKGLRYQNLNDVKGALQGALAEFDRRIVGPYEDKKIAENGDVNVLDD